MKTRGNIIGQFQGELPVGLNACAQTVGQVAHHRIVVVQLIAQLIAADSLTAHVGEVDHRINILAGLLVFETGIKPGDVEVVEGQRTDIHDELHAETPQAAQRVEVQSLTEVAIGIEGTLHVVAESAETPLVGSNHLRRLNVVETEEQRFVALDLVAAVVEEDIVPPGIEALLLDAQRVHLVAFRLTDKRVGAP